MTRRKSGADTAGNPDDGAEIGRLVAMVRADPIATHYNQRYEPPAAWTGSQTGSMDGWGEFDPALLDDGRAAVPMFPLDVLPPFWRDWARDTAAAAGAPVDYVAMALLAAVAGLGGAGVRVQASPGWQEPLVLWQALVGPASSGKSPAIASLRGLVATLTAQKGALEGESPLADVAAIIAADASGSLLWCDQPLDWLARLAGAANSVRTRLLRGWSPSIDVPIALVACLQPDGVSQIATIGPELAARFLYAWPHPPSHRPLSGRRAAADGEALAALRRLQQMVGTAQAPAILALARDALPSLDSFLATLHDEMAEAEGLEQAWLGKGRGTVVRLAGCLALLERSIGAAAAADTVSRKTVEGAIVLWRDYLRPQARAVLQFAAPDDTERKARRVVRWLKARGAEAVSREEIRVEALSRSVNAVAVDRILYRLQWAGIVRKVHFSLPSQGGRPPSRWEVNPRLGTTRNAGNAGNLPGPA